MANPLLRTFTRVSLFSPGGWSRPADFCLRNARAGARVRAGACTSRCLGKRDPPARAHAGCIRTLMRLLRQRIHGESINAHARISIVSNQYRINDVKTVILKFNGRLIKHMYNFHDMICINAR